LLEGYCKRFDLIVENVKLKFDGQTLKMKSTPISEDMDDDDIIDVQINTK
jgi:hypothetical protein